MEERDIQLIFEMLKEFKAESKAWREELAAETRATQARTQMIKAETKAIEGRTAAMREKRLKANMKAWQDETLACQEMEARPEEKLTSVDRKPETAEERQVPEENAEVIPVGEPRNKRRKDRKLAADPGKGWVSKKTGRRQQRDEPPCGSGMENASRQEDAPSRDSGTTHERHLQAEHDSQRNHYQERSHQGQHGTRNLETTDVREETSAATEMQRGHEKRKCRGTATQVRIAEKLDVVEVSASSGTTKQALDLVEGSTPCKTEKETPSRGGTGNTEASASPERVNED
jgi:hypothetical protein